MAESAEKESAEKELQLAPPEERRRRGPGRPKGVKNKNPYPSPIPTNPNNAPRFMPSRWPTVPPYEISQQIRARFHLCDRVNAEKSEAIAGEHDGEFPWVQYLARSFGPGVYMVGSGDGTFSTIVVDERLRSVFGLPLAGAAAINGASRRRQQQKEDDDDEPEHNPPMSEDDELELVAERIERTERLKERLGLSNPPPAPPPPPKPSPWDVLSNPAVVGKVIDAVQRALSPAQNPPPAPKPSPWDQVGEVYQSLGMGPGDVLAVLRQQIADHEAAIRAQMAADAEAAQDRQH